MPVTAARLVLSSMVIAVVAWLIVIGGFCYAEFVLAKVPARHHTIFVPGAFFFLISVLTGSAISCLGLLLFGAAIYTGARRGLHFWIAACGNGILCIPMVMAALGKIGNALAGL